MCFAVISSYCYCLQAPTHFNLVCRQVRNLLFESQSWLPAGIACSCQTPIEEFLLYSHTEQRSRLLMGSLEDTGLFLYKYSVEMEMSFSSSLGFCLSLCHFDCSVTRFLLFPPSCIPRPHLPFVFLFLPLCWSVFPGTLCSLWIWKPPLRLEWRDKTVLNVFAHDCLGLICLS